MSRLSRSSSYLVRPSHSLPAFAALACLFIGLFGLAFGLAPATASAHASANEQALRSEQALHAKFVGSNPSPDAVLKTPPSVVTLHFIENVNPTGSDVTVYDSKWKVVSTGPATVERNDAKSMTVNMVGDDSEVYVVVWHNVSLDDGDPYAGSFSFTISATATGSTSTTAATSTSSGVSPLVVALLGLLGLVIGGAGGFLLARRRG